MRLAVYTDQKYWRRGDAVFAERAFIGFIGGLAAHGHEVTVLGRLVPGDGESHYRLDDGLAFAPLPHYESAADPGGVLRALGGSVRSFWRVLAGVDAVWLLGPSPFAIVFAAMAKLRRRTVVLGVRQDYPAYARNRHPGNRPVALLAHAQEALFRLLARSSPTVTVGTELARHYARSPAVLPIAISLVREDEVADPETALARDWDEDELRVLSVGRLATEKNPLLMADVLARLVERDPRWRLIVCGDGPLEDDLAARLRELGVDGHAELRGHVSLETGLLDLYRTSHALLHVSWTEGLPQVLIEAFAAGLPVVATAVGGVADACGDAALLVGPGDADAPAAALERLRTERELRATLTRRAIDRARTQTLEATTGRVAAFIAAARTRR